MAVYGRGARIMAEIKTALFFNKIIVGSLCVILAAEAGRNGFGIPAIMILLIGLCALSCGLYADFLAHKAGREEYRTGWV